MQLLANTPVGEQEDNTELMDSVQAIDNSFENKAYRQIGYLMNIGHTTAQRCVSNAILNLGRALYGMEKEFWDKFK